MAETPSKRKTMHTKRVNSGDNESGKRRSRVVGENQDSPSVQTEALLAKRGTTHGSFFRNGHVSQGIKNVTHSSPGWWDMAPHRREALDLIATKISRICSGQDGFVDHWEDIAGYAILGKK